jgi:hypothetical protein
MLIHFDKFFDGELLFVEQKKVVKMVFC